MKTIYELCVPRADVLSGSLRDETFAADLSQVVQGKAVSEYSDPAHFFTHTHPTRGLKSLLEAVCKRLIGTGDELSSVIRLDTQFGGGKTHALIALVHAVRGMQGVPNIDEFIDPLLLPKGPVRLAALDGERADPANGLQLGAGIVARSLWGEMAWQLAGRSGYERVRASDEKHIAPGHETIIELFGDEPTLILLDEVAVYLRKAARAFPDAEKQYPAFLQALIKAVSMSPRVAFVSTLAIRTEDQTASDAYSHEQESIFAAFSEVDAIYARKLQPLNPTMDDETVNILRRRMFESIDASGASETLAAYKTQWLQNKESLESFAQNADLFDQFEKGYPFHPEVMSVMTTKMASLPTFQRTRGMLRLLARTVRTMWAERPLDAYAIHAHHIDLGIESIREEFLTRMQQGAFAPVLNADVAAMPGMAAATAQQIDEQRFAGMPPVASYVARMAFLHTMAGNESAQGIDGVRLRYAVCSPAVDPALVESARKEFQRESLYLDDRPGAPLRFRVEPNLTQMILRTMETITDQSVRDELTAKIRHIFTPRHPDFDPIFEPAGPHHIPDEIGAGRPYLAILNYDAHAVSENMDTLAQDIRRMAEYKGTNESPRLLRNNVIFLAADEKLVKNMKQHMRRRLALEAILHGAQLQSLAEHQQHKVKEYYATSDVDVAVAIAQCYRHLFYPTRSDAASADSFLGRTTIELPNAAAAPGYGQDYIRRALRDQNKLRSGEDTPDAPSWLRDRTPLKTKGWMSTRDLRNEYRRSPALAILLSDVPFIKCIQSGIEQSSFVYRKDTQVWGKGDPMPSILIDDSTYVHTALNAQEQGLWPRKTQATKKEGSPSTGSTGSEAVIVPLTIDTALPPSTPALYADGLLKPALMKLFDEIRLAGWQTLETLHIEFFERVAFDAVHPSIAGMKGASVKVLFHMALEAEGISELSVAFSGDYAKLNTVKSWIAPVVAQRPTALNIDGKYMLTFDPPIAVDQASENALIERLCKHGTPEVHLTAYEDGGHS